jgi:hypothetical protein
MKAGFIWTPTQIQFGLVPVRKSHAIVHNDSFNKSNVYDVSEYLQRDLGKLDLLRRVF